MKEAKRNFIGIGLWLAAVAAVYFGYRLVQNAQFAAAEEKREELRQSLARIDDIAVAFRQVSKVVEPSVVNIRVIKKAPAAARRRSLPWEDFLRRFRDRDDDGLPDLPDLPRFFDPDEWPEQMGNGSGVIMETAGGKAYIVTNNHVVGGADEMIITLHDGREVKNGKVVGVDAKTDLALVVVEVDRVSPAKWGNSDELQKGDWVLAFGSPFGYVGSMTHGIVSALNRQAGILGAGGYESFIQVDAPINPGNSGGPLVNLKGEVVGINTAIASRTGGFQGIGFAIPSNLAKFVCSALKDKGKVVRGWLGVSISDVATNQQMARSFGYDGTNGVLVNEVLANTPAVGKLKHGDIITEVDGKPVENVTQLRNSIAAIAPGTEIKMKVFRDGKYETVAVKLGEQPENLASARPSREGGRGDTASADALGITVQTVTKELAERHGLDVTSGVVITSVQRGSPAAYAGLRAGDVITEVDRQQIRTAEDFNAAMRKQDLKKGVRLYVTTREGSRFVFIQADK